MSERNGFAAEAIPHNDQYAEKYLLCSLLRDNSVIGDLLDMHVSAQDFYMDINQKIFSAALRLWADGSPADIVTVTQKLYAEKSIDSLDYPSLGKILDTSPTCGAHEHYAGIVKDMALMRGLFHTAGSISRNVSERRAGGKDLLEDAEKEINALADGTSKRGLVTISQAMLESMNRYDERANKTYSDGVKTGLIDIDKKLCGFQPGELIVIAARTSRGKTAFGITIARHAACEQGKVVLFCSLEQSHVELADRILCAHGMVNSFRLRSGTLTEEEIERASRTKEAMEGIGLHFDSSCDQNVLNIGSNARRLKMRGSLGLIVIDYIGLIQSEAVGRRDSRQEQIAAITRRLKRLARELEVPVIVLAQLNREVEHRADEKPRLADLRDSGAIEQDADTVILLSWIKGDGDDSSPSVKLLVDIAKQRNGPTGEESIIYIKEFMRFENCCL